MQSILNSSAHLIGSQGFAFDGEKNYFRVIVMGRVRGGFCISFDIHQTLCAKRYKKMDC